MATLIIIVPRRRNDGHQVSAWIGDTCRI